MLKAKPTLTSESSFNQAPPGYSLAGGPPGKWPWEQPPEHATAEQAVDALIDNMEKPEVQEMYVQLMAAGVSIEEIVNPLVKFGFMEGKFTVDVAEVIKAPLAIYLMGLASEAGVDVKVFTTQDGLPRTNYGLKDATLLRIMKDRNPDFAKYLTSEFPRQVQERREQQAMAQQQLQEQSFLAVEEQEDALEGEIVEEPMQGEEE